MSRFLNRHQDVLTSLVNQGWKVVSGPILLLTIPLFISPEQQGLWYAFGSVSALSVFADLGMTAIVTQFAAHEFAFLRFDGTARLVGDSAALVRLSSLLRFCLRWISVAVVILAPVIFVSGFLLFVQKVEMTSWILPWFIFVSASMLSVVNAFLCGFLQGCGQIAQIQGRQLFANLVQFGLLVVLLVLHAGLWALAIGVALGSLVLSFLILARYRLILRSLLANKERHEWAGAVLPLFGKYSLSWVGGYFSGQLFVPISFQFFGASIAGRVGITLTLVNAASAMVSTFQSVKLPAINMAVSVKNEQLAHTLSVTATKRALAGLFLLGSLVVLALILGRYSGLPLLVKLLDRFADPWSFALLFLSQGIGIVLTGMAYYLRAHKVEPYVVPSLVGGALTMLTLFVFASLLPWTYYFVAPLAVSLLTFPMFVVVYQRRKLGYFGENLGERNGHRSE